MAAESPVESNRRAALAATFAALLMIVQQVGAKATRDTYFLSHYAVTELPKVMTGSAVLSVLGALGMSALLTRFGPKRIVPIVYVLSASMFAVDWALAERAPAIAAIVIYLHLGAFGPILISGFWSLINERFDPHTAKKNVGRIAGSAALGGVLGGFLAQQVTAHFSLAAMLPLLGSVSLVAAGVIFLITTSAESRATQKSVDAGEPSRLRGTKYLQQLAILVLLTSLASGVLDFAMKSEVASATADAAEMAAFFGIFHAVVGVLVFAVQTGLSSVALKRLGIGGTLAILPGAIVLGGVLSGALVKLWTVVLAKGLDVTLQSSLYRAGYELLYTPVSPAQKRASKTIIDVVFDRLGDIAAAGIVTAAIAIFPAEATRAVLVVAAIAGLLSLAFALRLHRGYVRELTQSLRSGVLSVDEVAADDATTQRTLTDTTMAMDREQLLREIKALQKREGAKKTLSERARTLISDEHRKSSAARTQLLTHVEVLLSNEPVSLRKLLSQRDLEAQLIPMIVPLLEYDDVAREAMQALQRFGLPHIGPLIDVLLDEREPVSVRRRVPRVLDMHRSLRVRDGLLESLFDSHLEVRFQAGRSLLRLVERDETMTPVRAVVFDAVLRETTVSPASWGAEARTEDASSTSLIASNGALVPRLRHIMTLLSTVLEREPLELCLKAFSSGGEALQGTALEYLENVLPANVYRGLGRHLKEATFKKEPREREHIIEELHQSVTSLKLDREALSRL